MFRTEVVAIGGLRWHRVGSDDVSALSDWRKVVSGEKQVWVHAFAKAIRRKPLAFAADAVTAAKTLAGSLAATPASSY